MPERWQVRGVNGASALDAWAGVLAATHIPFDVRATYRTPKAFQGMVTRRRFGDLMLVDCASSPFLGHWALGQPSEQIVGFQLIRKGVEQVRERSRKVALTAGDMILWDGLQPVDV
jgi:hypothetical protein